MNLKFVTVILVALVWRNLALGGDIFDAAKSGDLEKVRALLKSNPNLVFSNNSDAGFTPLHWAVRFSHKEVAELLLTNKSNVDATDGWGRTPLMFAVFDRDKEMAELLLQSNANVEFKDRTFGYSPLRWAMNNHNLELMQLFLAYKADVNTKDNNGFTPLGYATGTNEAKWLLANKADVNARDTTCGGGTPLHWAAFRGQKDVSELLLASNADVNARDNSGGTPLHWAARKGQKAVVELLLASNANVNAKDNSGNTPLQFAFDNKDIAAFLRQHGGHGKENTTKPLVGWYLDGDTDSQHDKAILDDYQAYAHTVWPRDHDFFFSEVNFYEDGTGRHAVRIVLEPGLRYYKEYYLLYDTNNVRTKVIKGRTWHQGGM
jgi:ankyrin repeat protein